MTDFDFISSSGNRILNLPRLVTRLCSCANTVFHYLYIFKQIKLYYIFVTFKASNHFSLFTNKTRLSFKFLKTINVCIYNEKIETLILQNIHKLGLVLKCHTV